MISIIFTSVSNSTLLNLNSWLLVYLYIFSCLVQSQLHHCRIYELTDAQLYSQDFSKFSKAQISDVSFSYVHHLFNCNEMLGPLLVYRYVGLTKASLSVTNNVSCKSFFLNRFRHNLKTYAEFFEQIRRFSHSKHLLASYIIWFVNTQSQDKVPQGI